jgi:hypothetical protein
MVNATRLLSRLVLASTLFLALAACDKGAPSSPTPFGCVYTLSVTGISVPGSGASTTIGVTTTSQCAWSATSNRDWVTITDGATGTGSGTVAVVISPNPASSIRTGTLTVAGQAVSVSESGQACAVTLSPTVAAVPPGEATGSLMVAAPVDCAWTAVGSVAWLTIATGATGIGNGVIAYAVGANTGPLARSGTIAVNESTFSVNQDGDPALCTYVVTPLSFTPCISEPSSMTAMVTTQAACTWTATAAASWITVTGGQSGTGSGSISFRVTDNFDSRRFGNVQVRWPTVNPGQDVDVAQAGCTYGVSPSSMLVSGAGGPGQFQVVQQTIPQCGGTTPTRCQWTAVSNSAWITVTTPMPQVGDNSVSFVLAPNDTGAFRTGTIVVGDQVVSITQEG